MRLRTLEIQQLPGAGAVRIDGLAAGVNLVTGPNAVGKSSLIRALWYLIGGARPDDPAALAITAEFEAEDGHWRVRRAGSQLAWTRNGEPSDPPALPSADLLHCYWLRVEDLLSADTTRDAVLVRQLRSELSGGYDLDALHAAFEFGPKIGQREAKLLQQAQRARRDVENTHRALHDEAARLPAMRDRAEAAERASRQVDRLERALALLEARRARIDAEQRLNRFPSGMEQLRGNELTRLAELESERAAAVEEREAQTRARDEAAAALDALGLAAERPSAAELQAQRERLADCATLNARLEEEAKRLNEARAQERRATLALGATRALPRLDPESVDQAGALAGRLQQLRQEHEDRRAALTRFDAQRRETAGASSGHTALIAALAFLGGLAAGAAAVLLPAPWWRLAVAAFLAGAGFWGLVESIRRWAGRRAEAAFRERRRRELEDELAQGQSMLDACEREREQFCAERGIDPDLFGGAALERFVRLTVDLDRARDARFAAAQTVEALQARIADQDRAVESFLARWHAAPADAGVGLKVALETLERRCHEAAQAEDARLRAERESERLQAALGRCDEKIAQLFAESGLEAGARAALEQRCADFDEWQQRCAARNEAMSVEAERRNRLAEAPDLIERADADDEAGLQAERECLIAQAADRDRLRDAVLELEHRLRTAGQERELEEAGAAEDRAREALGDRFDQAMVAEAGRLLLDEVAAEYRNDHEPALLADASERFARFTHRAWSLELDPSTGFHAVDRATEEPRSLGELSSGTRMQLLLAVRIAWARQIERDKKPLPLFLDEALTTSDAGRFGEVAAALERLTQDEGRQVFYLSARRQEVALWEHATGLAPHVVDLAEIRFGRSDAEADDYALPERKALPAPDGREPEQYAAALGVPAVDPRAAATAIHPFHLLRDDLSLLHRLMEHWRIRNLGTLEALLDSEAAAHAVPDARMRAALSGRCQLAREWTAIWRQGRGKPVDRGVLEATGAVSAKFIDQVAELADQLDGDGTALIDALRSSRVPRFRTAATDELSEWLRINGYTDPAEPLDPAERERRALQAAAGHGHPEALREVIHWLEAGAGTAEKDGAGAATRVPA